MKIRIIAAALAAAALPLLVASPAEAATHHTTHRVTHTVVHAPRPVSHTVCHSVRKGRKTVRVCTHTVSAPAAAPAPAPAPAPLPSASALPVLAGPLPTPAGLGPAMSAQLNGHNQAVVAIGGDWFTQTGTLSQWERTPQGWVELGSWGEWNARDGWTTTPSASQWRSPAGVFPLTDAGGYVPSPGSRLPYDYNTRSYSLISHGVRTFNHVIAIGYNHVPGTSPMSLNYPLGEPAGGHFWLHVQHGSFTAGCITIDDAGIVQLQQTLDPAEAPILLSGPASFLAQ